MRRLIAQLLFFHIGILFLFGIAFVAFIVQADEGGALIDAGFVDIATAAIDRGADGKLRLHETEAWRELRRTTPDIWFVARSDQGEILEVGDVPEVYRALASHLDRLTFADIRDISAPFDYMAVIRHVTGPGGDLTILGKGSLFSMTFVILFLSNLLMVPILLILTLITLVATPLIIRRAFAGLSVIADEAGRININRRGYRLPANDIPFEVVPFVGAVNGALQRLDEGYERHQRFIIDAAHELRTPIAILQAKVEATGDRLLALQLGRDIGRLATLADQLLDLQRLDRITPMNDAVDLAVLARRVAADTAPYVIMSGGELEFVDLGGGLVRGDPPAMERVVTNLIQNAIEHGGRRVTIRVGTHSLEVEDDGPGIPIDERERIFEAFHRLHAKQTGAGLGLNLVQQVMDRHGGSVEAFDAPDGGTVMRLEFVGSAQG